MTRQLISKTALITGAAKRIGAGIAQALAEAGCSVALHYDHSEEDAWALAEELSDLGVQVWTYQHDLSDTAEVENWLTEVWEATGGIDYLVNNASIFPKDTLLECTPESIWENMRVNALSPMLLTRALYQQGGSASVVNLLDARITDYDRDHLSYHLSKRMLHDLTRIMALEFSPDFRVNAIAPGLILPPPGEDERYLEKMRNTNPLNAIGSVAEIADAVLFLLRSDFITGQTLYVDGGRNLKGSIYD